MRMSRRAVLHGIGGGGVDYAYTGTFDAFGDEFQGYLVLKTSGTLTIKGTVDLCLVGGGGRGAPGEVGSTAADLGGGGGAGGYVQNYLTQSLDNSFSVTIGAGSTSTSAGGQSKVGTSYTASGGNSATNETGASGRGTGGSAAYSKKGGNGEAGVYPFNDSANFASFQVSGCGGGGGHNSTYGGGSGGAGGGGNGGTDAAGTAGSTNTGGGGGGGARRTSGAARVGGSGGSGVVFVRWGY